MTRFPAAQDVLKSVLQMGPEGECLCMMFLLTHVWFHFSIDFETFTIFVWIVRVDFVWIVCAL